MSNVSILLTIPYAELTGRHSLLLPELVNECDRDRALQVIILQSIKPILSDVSSSLSDPRAWMASPSAVDPAQRFVIVNERTEDRHPYVKRNSERYMVEYTKARGE